ncbi:MAG: hypothetical protein NVS3B21_35790 [Acidimicrobiales bacterium]
MVLGASFDTPQDNRTFAETQSFPFRLLSDAERRVGLEYEVRRDAGDPKADYPLRVAYLIDPAGVIRKAYEVTDTAGFGELATRDLTALTTPGPNQT